MKVVTQKDVAQTLGISQTAVSSVLGKALRRNRLNAKMQKRVLNMARKMGYRSNSYAQVMRNGRSGIIGVVQCATQYQTFWERSFYAAKAIHEAGFELRSVDVLWYDDGAHKAFETLLDARVEGILLVNLSHDLVKNAVPLMSKSNVPVVSIGWLGYRGIPQACADYRQGMTDLVAHLFSLGHRRLTLLTPDSSRRAHQAMVWNLSERVRGFRDGLLKVGLPASAANIVYEDSHPFDVFLPGRRGMERILQRKHRPRVVLCSNDYWAVGAMRVCLEAGVDVPGEMAITGFDDTTMGRYVSPPLTTVSQPNEAIARAATNLLIASIKGTTLARQSRAILQSCRLVVRESCGAALVPVPTTNPI
ncbi:MAG: LacI family DNA-binding transcriptional regulator [Verrucomicrobia bacterium]|nr:LacI family DNA-binding transcriptional regulator [Verrucomicrobiota bacterium]